MADSGAPPPATNLPELSVSELSFAIKRTMETNFDRVRVRGELGRVTVAKSGHLYADLKDENSCISLVMWKANTAKLAFKPAEGLEVVAEGKLTTFPGKSQYQLVAERMAPAGVGALLAQLERLKAKLQAEGLFAPERKKKIPYLPDVIGVVTSPTGAVIRDILHRLADRFPRRVLLWPVLVQGEQAAGQVAAAIRGFNNLPEGGAVPRPDLLIVARGGGSIEDLWAFNEEIVVRAAAESIIPLISAVGHETDTTLIDFASDLRAPTPTGAAEKAVPVRTQLIEQTGMLGGRLSGALVRGVERRRTELRAAAARLPKPETTLAFAQQKFDRASERLASALLANTRSADSKLARVAARLRPEALPQAIARRRERLEGLAVRLRPEALQQSITQRRARLEDLDARLSRALERRVADKEKHLLHAARLLDTLSHKSVLARGFALVTGADGRVVRRAKNLAGGDQVRLSFADGDAPATIGQGAAAPPPSAPASASTVSAAPAESPKKRPKPADQGSLF